MKKPSIFSEPKEHWEYMQHKGKVYFYIIQPIYSSILLFAVLLVFYFLLISYKYGLNIALKNYKEIFSEDLIKLISIMVISTIISSIVNIINWLYDKKKFS